MIPVTRPGAYRATSAVSMQEAPRSSVLNLRVLAKFWRPRLAGRMYWAAPGGKRADSRAEQYLTRASEPLQNSQRFVQLTEAAR